MYEAVSSKSKVSFVAVNTLDKIDFKSIISWCSDSIVIAESIVYS